MRTKNIIGQVFLLNMVIGRRMTAFRLLVAASVFSYCQLLHLFAAHGRPRGNRRRQRRQRNNAGDGVTENSDDPVAASYARFSTQMQSEEGIPLQHEKNREAAHSNGHTIPTELEFSDEAVSGTKRERDGLNAMLAAAEAGLFSTLYLYSLSRLARETVISLPMLKRLVYKFNIRVISLVDGLDSARDGWELVAHVIAIVNEQFIKELRASVLRGQEGTLLAGFSVGDYRFGYSSVPVPGSEVNRRGRRPKPKKIYVINKLTAPWVMRIFEWWVEDRQKITWIVRELNRLGVPKDHRSTTPEWRHELVVGVLESEKYIGIWPWGEMANVRDPETGNIRQEPRDEEESAKWTRHFPHLRLVDEETFELAQRYLEEYDQNRPSLHSENGRFRGSKAGTGHPRHLLSSLIICKECGRKFYVGGANGKYLFCPGYKRGLCGCQTQLRRDRAERMILDAIGKRILADTAWLQAVYDETLAIWRHKEQQVPQELEAARRRLTELERKIARLVDQIEDGIDDPAVRERLKDRRTERRSLVKAVEKLRRFDETRGPEPTAEWVEEQLAQLGQTMNGDTPAAAIALREIVGGEIVVEEIRKEGRQRHHLRGRFTIVSSSLSRAVGGQSDRAAADVEMKLSEEIVIDFVDDDAKNELLDRVLAMHRDEEMLCADIAKEVGCSRSRMTKLLKMAYARHGLTKPDGRSRRSTLKKKHSQPPLYQQISEEVKRLYDADLLLGDIAEHLGVDHNTITSAVRFWHESRDLEPPDGRTRRKNLGRKKPQEEDDDQQRPDADSGTK